MTVYKPRDVLSTDFAQTNKKLANVPVSEPLSPFNFEAEPHCDMQQE
jgi:hypothetical protein